MPVSPESAPHFHLLNWGFEAAALVWEGEGLGGAQQPYGVGFSVGPALGPS